MPGGDNNNTEDGRALRAVVFDFDGVIIDTESTALLAWQQLYESFGQELPLDEWVNLIGTWDAVWDPRADLERRIERKLDWDRIEPGRMAAEYELADAQRLLPGIAGLLDDAARAGIPLAIASSSSLTWVAHHLDRLGIADRFEVLATRHDVPRTKPDPALYALALERLGVSAHAAFALEDSVHGVASALAAGLQVVAVPGALMHGADFSAATLRLESLDRVTLASLASHLGFDL